MMIWVQCRIRISYFEPAEFHQLGVIQSVGDGLNSIARVKRRRLAGLIEAGNGRCRGFDLS